MARCLDIERCYSDDFPEASSCELCGSGGDTGSLPYAGKSREQYRQTDGTF